MSLNEGLLLHQRMVIFQKYERLKIEYRLSLINMGCFSMFVNTNLRYELG
jgi:hypothetical protein